MSNVYVLQIDHRHGEDVSVHESEQGARAAAANWAREYWDEVAGLSDVPDETPSDDEDAISIYFDAHEREFYSITETSVSK